jgi:hypothetical protein
MVYVVPPNIQDNKAFCFLGYNDGLTSESHRTTWYCTPEGVIFVTTAVRASFYSLSGNTIFLV